MIFRTPVANYSFSDNLREDIDIVDVMFLRALAFEFNGTLTAAGGAADGALVEDGLLKTILKSIQIRASGSDPFVDTIGLAEYFRRAILSGSPGVHVSVIPTGAASTAQRVHVVIDFDELASAAKFAGRIDLRKLSALTLRVLAGAVETDRVTGGDRVESMTGTMEVYAISDDGNREIGKGLGFRKGGRRVDTMSHTVVGATSHAELIIPSGLLI